MSRVSVVPVASRRRSARFVLAAISALSLASTVVVVSSGTAVATVESDRGQITKLEQQIAAQGVQIETLVEKANKVQAQVSALDEQIAHDRSRLGADQKIEAASAAIARRVAVEAYMNAGRMGTSTFAVFGNADSVRQAFEQNSYLSAANSKIDAQLNQLASDRARTQGAERALRAAHEKAAATLRDLQRAQQAASRAIAANESTLRHVKGNLSALLAAAAAKARAAELAQERALAAAPPAPQAPPPPSLPPPPPVSPSPGTYANPLRAVAGLNPERIDQGVDFSGFGPIYAIGDGVVLSTFNGGWPGGTFIAYRLTNGPARGLVVYFAEDIQPAVSVGQTVNANTVLGRVYEGPTGIEVGWADPSANGDTMARSYGQYHGSNSTAFGYNFSRLLQALGAPGGVLQNDPPTGSVPGGWPQW